MTVEDLITQFVEDMAFSTLLNWACIFHIAVDTGMWLDDEWSEKEDELRKEVVDAILRVGKD